MASIEIQANLDILIEPTAENGKRLIAALENIGLELPETQPEEFEKELVLSFGLQPDAVDILNYTPGADFNNVYRNAVQTSFSGIQIRIIDIQDLFKNKEQLNRPGEKSLLDKFDAAVPQKNS